MLASEAERNSTPSISAPRSFVDLRAFAADPQLGNRLPIDPDKDQFLTNRRELALPDGPIGVGVIDLPEGQGRVAAMPADEFIIACNGAVTIIQQDRSLVLQAGESCVLPRGASFEWRCDAAATLLYMRCAGGEKGEGALVAIDEAAELEPSGAPLAELLIGPTPQCRNHGDYRSANGEFLCGTWDSTPYHRTAMLYRHYELMHLLAGSVTFEDEAGNRRTFSKGDIFLVEQNAQCSWESREYVKKVYAIYRPA